MTRADAKAAMVAAYASGARPEFVRLLPDGKNELWQLSDVALVIPTVPPDAPSDLEYAFRLRRDTMISGRCDGCGAVPEATPVAEARSDRIVWALFNHRKNCPAEDANTLRAYERYRASVKGQTLDDRVEAANARTRRELAVYVGEGSALGGEDLQAAATRLLDGLLAQEDVARICSHLSRDPLRTWHCLIAEGRWECAECWARRAAEDLAIGRSRLSSVEDFTCDLCRRYAPNTLDPLLLRIDIFMMHGGVCARCRAQYAVEETSEG